MDKDKILIIETNKKHSTLDVFLLIIGRYFLGFFSLAIILITWFIHYNKMNYYLTLIFILYLILRLTIKTLKNHYISNIKFIVNDKIMIMNRIYPFLKKTNISKYKVKSVKLINIPSRYGKPKAIEITTVDEQKIHIYPINYHFLGKDKVFNFIKEINQYL